MPLPAATWVSAPTELVQAFVVDAEVVGHLVDDGHRDLVQQFVAGGTHALKRPLEDRHAVRQAPAPVLSPVGNRNPVVDAEEILLAVRGLGLHEDGDVGHCFPELCRNELQGLFNSGVKLLGGEPILALSHDDEPAIVGRMRPRLPAPVRRGDDRAMSGGLQADDGIRECLGARYRPPGPVGVS